MMTHTELETRVQEVRKTLTALGEEPPALFHEIQLSTIQYAHAKLGWLGGDFTFRVRYGKTIDCGPSYAQKWWGRRSVTEFTLDGHRLSPQAMEALEKLQSMQLPIGCSVVVWSLGVGGSDVEPRDHLLVIEYSLAYSCSTCFALCRWNG